MGEDAEAYVYLGMLLIVLGFVGYFTEKRKRGADGVRRFLISYAIVWPFFACELTGLLYHRLHWLIYVGGAIAVLTYYPLALRWRQKKATPATHDEPAGSKPRF